LECPDGRSLEIQILLHHNYLISRENLIQRLGLVSDN
jgi:hypothetical protein